MKALQSVRSALVRNYFNFHGWSTNRHIVVIESDDWGSVRMPSLKVYNLLKANNVQLGQYGYEKYDTIASCEDLYKLFEICEKHRDIYGNPVVITANCVVANPDFERIIKDDYSCYYYEPITETMQRYYPNESPFNMWKEGIEHKCFFPQFHGREHVNVPLWMKSLRADVNGARLACEHGVFSVLVDKSFDARKKNTASFYYVDEEERKVVFQSIKDGLELFQKLFGFRSKSMIAPSYEWTSDIEKLVAQLGVKYIQSVHTHSESGRKQTLTVGKQNEHGQRYLLRNANFEYSQNPEFDYFRDCLRNIAAAFRWHKPVTISAHRLNFIGSLVPENRDNNLILFDQLLTEIQKRWPDVEFMTSPQLGQLIDEQDC